MTWTVKDAAGEEKGSFPRLTNEEGQQIRAGLPEGWTITHYISMPDPEVGTRMDWIRFRLGTGPEPGSPDWELLQPQCNGDNYGNCPKHPEVDLRVHGDGT